MNDDCGSPASEVIKACKLLPHCEHAASVPASADGKKRGSPMDEFESWVSAIATGAATMSQRNFKWVEANGGIDQLVAIATQQGVHLVKLTDDKGNNLLAASQNLFVTLC